jgi:hypothetical protein
VTAASVRRAAADRGPAPTKRRHITVAVGPVLVIRQSKQNPRDAEWDESLEQFRVMLSVHGMDTRVLIHTDGGGLNAGQRDSMKQLLEKMPIRCAVLSDSVFARLLSSTFALFNRNLRSYSVAGLADAMAFLDVSDADNVRVQEALERMTTQLE